MNLTSKSHTKLQKLIPLLASDKDGEVVAAARGIQRLLVAQNFDFHDLAKMQGGATRIEYREKIVYRDRIIVKEKIVYRDVRSVQPSGLSGQPNVDPFAANPDGYHSGGTIPGWRSQAFQCNAKSNSLKTNEAAFIHDMANRAEVRGSTISEKQERWLNSIYLKMKGGTSQFMRN